MKTKEIATPRGTFSVPYEIYTEIYARLAGFYPYFTAYDRNGNYIGEIYSRSKDGTMYHHEFILVQPYLKPNDIPEKVIESVKEYLEENNLGKLCRVIRMSNHPEDSYLYGVISKKSKYSCWTCWNQTTKSLNFGHYGIETEEDAMKIIINNFHDCRKNVAEV